MQNCKYNKELCRQLKYMANYYTKKGLRMPYGFTYNKAVRAISEFVMQKDRPLELSDYTTMTIDDKGKHKTKIKGIGKGIAEKINQFFRQGFIEEYELAKRDQLLNKKIAQGKVKRNHVSKDQQSINELAKISYIGQTTAKKMVTQYGITSISQLKELVKNGEIDSKKAVTFTAPKGGLYKLNKNQVKMLGYHSKLKRIPREFTEALEESTKYIIAKKFGKKAFDIVFAGSYRRKAETSGDVDIIIKSKKYTIKDFVKVLKEWGVIFDTLSSGTHDFKGLGRCPGMKNFIFRIDILQTNDDDWYAALLHFTGSDLFNRIMREKAKNLMEYNGKSLPYGAILSQKGFFIRGSDGKSSGKRVVSGGLQSEKQLFDIFNMVYLKPSERGDKFK